MVDVFISYSRENQALVRQLAEAVKREGYSVWWDDELPPHLSYGDVITEKIGAAKAAIVVWSESASASEWVRAEADVARSQKKLIQTSIDGRMPPMPFNQIQFASIGDWRGEDDHSGWRKVKASLAALCGERAGAGAIPAAPPPAYVPPAPVAHAPVPPPPAATQTAVTAPPHSAPASAPARNNSWLVPMLAALALLVLIGLGGFFWLNGGQGGESAARADGAGNASAPVAPALAPGAAPGVARTDERFTQAATIDDPDGYTNVRSGASEQAFIVTRVNRGEIFTTYPQDGQWWQIRLADGRTGYMARSRIRVIEAGDGAPAATAAAAAPAATGGQGEILPNSAARLLTEEDLEDLSKHELFVARNEIFARHGRIFQSPALRSHFARLPWYRPRAGEIRLSATETANVRLIAQEEQER